MRSIKRIDSRLAEQRVLAGPRLDRLPICSFHYRILGLIGSGLFLDSFDIYMQGPILAQMVQTGWSTPMHNASFLSATFAGLFTGALVSGWLGDRFGRRKMYQANLLLFGLTTLLSAASPSFEFLVACRYIASTGLGGEIVTGYAMLAEFVPARVRGRWQGMLVFISNLGLVISALVCLTVIPRFGWRWVFALVGTTSLLVFIMRNMMPESPRWYESKGMLVEANLLLMSIEAEAERSTNTPLQSVCFADFPYALPADVDTSIRQLFRQPQLQHTILAMVLMICMNVSIFAFTAWVPTILVSSGTKMASTLLLTSIMQAGSLPGALLGAWVVDRFGRKPALVSFSLFAAIASSVFGFVGSRVGTAAVGFSLMVLLYALAAMTFGTYIPEMFPTCLRLRGSGISNASGRLANIVVPYGIVLLLVTWGSIALYLAIAAILLVQTVFIITLGEETCRKPLEQINTRLT